MDRETQFTTVLEANRDRIYRIYCCYIRNEDERQDVFQDVLLQIWKSLDTFANRSAISTWIFRVAVNVCLGHLRLAQRRNRLFTQEAADATDPATAGVPATDNPRQKESDLSHLYECIQRLPDLDKTLEEIRLSGISAGTSPRPPTQFLPPRFSDCAARATMRPVAAQFLVELPSQPAGPASIWQDRTEFPIVW